MRYEMENKLDLVGYAIVFVLICLGLWLLGVGF